jgi:hypothetical protein
MPALHLNDAGTWRQIQNVYVNDAGTWRQIQNVYVNDAGTWRLVYQAAVVFLTNIFAGHTAISPSNAFAAYELQADGDIQTYHGGTNGDSGDWITPKSASGASSYEVRATLLSGTTPAGTLGSWLALSVARSWSLSRSTIGTTTCDLTVEIRRASDGTILTSQTVTIEATKE